MSQPTSGYTQGADLLVLVAGKATGHATSHTIDATAETKSIACKPAQSKSIDKSLFDELIVIKKKVTVKADGLVNYGEDEHGAGSLLAVYDAAEPVALKGIHRKSSTTETEPNVYMTGEFILTSLNLTENMGEEATYSATFESTGPVTFTPAKFPGYVALAAGQSLNAPAKIDDALATKLANSTIKP